MADVIHIDSNARALNAIRQVIGARAKVTGAAETIRRRAVHTAAGWMAKGSSSGWATQAAMQVMRGDREALPRSGPEAA